MKLKFVQLIVLTAISLNASANTIKEVIYTKNAPEPIGTYSQAIRVNETIYLSGQIGIVPTTGELVEGGFDAQLKQTLTNLSEVAKAAGGSTDDIVKVNIFIKDLKDFQALNIIYPEFFKKPFPARSVVEIKALPKGALIEIEAIMHL